MPQLLIVDDDDLVRNALSLALQTLGHDVTVAASTDEALDHVDGGLWPDAVLADYRLRNQDTGVRTVQAIRLRLGETVPAIILTGDTSPDRLAEILRSGLSVLHKPVSVADLMSRIQAVITGGLPHMPLRRQPYRDQGGMLA